MKFSRLFVVIVEFDFCFWCCFLILIAHCCQDPFLVAVVHVLLTIRNVMMVFGLTAIAIVWQDLRASNCGVVNVEFCRMFVYVVGVPAKSQMFVQRDGSDGCERDAGSDGFDTFVTFCYDES